MSMNAALYKMSNNKYLGDCFSIVIETESVPQGCTRSDATIYVKTSKDNYNNISSLDDLKNTNLFKTENPYLRIGSECMLGMFGDSHCNCEEERIASLKQIREKKGIYIHLPQEAQGMGLYYKAQELHLQVHGIMPNGSYVGCKNQAEAAKLLTGHEIIDVRNFDFVADALKELNLDTYEYVFMSRNPNKVKSLKYAGINVGAMYDINTKMTPENMAEYLTKWIDKGYCFTMDEVSQVIECIEQGVKLPYRAVSLLEKAADLLKTEGGQEHLGHHLYVTELYKKKLFDSILNNYSMNIAA